jgi:hypothetical protein
MAEGDGFIYNDFKEQILIAGHNLETAAIKVALFSASYVPNIDTDTTLAGLSNQCSGTGYTAGGQALTGLAVTLDLANNRAVFDASDVTWTGLGPLSPQPAWAVLYNSTTGRLIAYWEIATLTNGGNFTLQFSTAPSAILLLS